VRAERHEPYPAGDERQFQLLVDRQVGVHVARQHLQNPQSRGSITFFNGYLFLTNVVRIIGLATMFYYDMFERAQQSARQHEKLYICVGGKTTRVEKKIQPP